MGTRFAPSLGTPISRGTPPRLRPQRCSCLAWPRRGDLRAPCLTPAYYRWVCPVCPLAQQASYHCACNVLLLLLPPPPPQWATAMQCRPCRSTLPASEEALAGCLPGRTCPSRCCVLGLMQQALFPPHLPACLPVPCPPIYATGLGALTRMRTLMLRCNQLVTLPVSMGDMAALVELVRGRSGPTGDACMGGCMPRC